MNGEWQRRFWSEVSRIERCMIVKVEDGALSAVPARALDHEPGALFVEVPEHFDGAPETNVCLIFSDPPSGMQMTVTGTAFVIDQMGAITLRVVPAAAEVWPHDNDDVLQALGELTNTADSKGNGASEPVIVRF